MINKETYKRLTNNNPEEYDPEYDFCAGCKYFGEPNGCNRWNGTCGNYERFIETYNRLTELEDKIENGKLIFAPQYKSKYWVADKNTYWKGQIDMFDVYTQKYLVFFGNYFCDNNERLKGNESKLPPEEVCIRNIIKFFENETD